MRRPDVADSLAPQDCLYTVETLGSERSYRVIGAVRRALTLSVEPQAIIDALAHSSTQIVTLTVTEKGYCLAGGTLDLGHPDIAHDLTHQGSASSAIGLLVCGLTERSHRGAGPVTVISCDNLADNGRHLEGAVRAFAQRTSNTLSAWLDRNVTFPETMVDSIVPATDDASRATVEAALGMTDLACVQREVFSQWVIENRFAGPRPPWPGVQLVERVGDFRRLKLHVLNAAHSALAYLGPPRGHVFVRQAIADPELAARLDGMILSEIASALPDLAVRDYWLFTRQRFANPMIDHRLDQIAQDGAQKLAERIYPLMRANLQAGRPVTRLAQVVRAWLDGAAPDVAVTDRVADPALFPEAFRCDPRMGAAVVEALP
jgi:fructuronate reductase